MLSCLVCTDFWFPDRLAQQVHFADLDEQYLWPDSAAPRYVLPMATSAGMCFATLATSWLVRWDLMRENKKIRRDDSGAKIFYAC